jgi:hypothetical protein
MPHSVCIDESADLNRWLLRVLAQDAPRWRVSCCTVESAAPRPVPAQPSLPLKEPHMEQIPALEWSAQARVHLNAGEKGGVGKSLVLRLLAQYFVDPAGV